MFYYTGFVNTFTENGRTFYPYPPLRGGGWLSQRDEKKWEEVFLRFVIPSAVEGSFSLAVRRRVFDSRERETPYHGRAEAVLPLKGLAKGRGKRGRKRFLAFARNDDAGKPAFPLLPLEGGAPKGRRLAHAIG